MAVEFLVLLVCQLLLFAFGLYRKRRAADAMHFFFPLVALVLAFGHSMDLLIMAQVMLLVPLAYQAILLRQRAKLWFFSSQALLSLMAIAGMRALEQKMWVADSSTYHLVLVVTALATYLRAFAIPAHFILHGVAEQDESFTVVPYALTPIGLILLQRLAPLLQNFSSEVFVFGFILFAVQLVYFSLQLLGNRSARILPLLVLHIVTLQGVIGLWGDIDATHHALFHLTVMQASLVVTGLTLTLDFLQQRYGRLDLREHYGLFRNSPFLAGAFLFFGLVAANFPGTLAFEFEETVSQIVSHFHISMVLALLMANLLTAISFYWLYCRLFTGEQRHGGRYFQVRAWESAALVTLGVTAIVVVWF